MNTTPHSHISTFPSLKLFFALSRTPHGLIDMATPAVAALLALGAFPPLRIVFLGLVTAFAGYTAVYALNDLVDLNTDKERLTTGADQGTRYLDAVFVRHPVARGLLTFRQGIAWMASWAVLGFAAAYLLNPVCAFILVLGFVLEAFYCRMLRVSHLRVLVSGIVKTLGGVAAVFAVTPDPSPVLLTNLFFWIFFWEIGGQNIPADWYDLEEDRRFGAKTFPVRYGSVGAGLMSLICLALSMALSVALLWFSPIPFSLPYLLLALAVAIGLLLHPALRLYRSGARAQTSMLFNRASYYPVAILGLVVVKIMLS
jgi:4-hydroxybenzoate polyprenyltransferase